MSQLSKKRSDRQEHIENSMALIGASIARLDHDSLRVRQAIRRSGLNDLLGRVLEDHEEIKKSLRLAQDNLREIWDDGQRDHWDK